MTKEASRYLILGLVFVALITGPIDLLCLILWQTDQVAVVQGDMATRPHHPDSPESHQHSPDSDDSASASQLPTFDVGGGLVWLNFELPPLLANTKMAGQLDSFIPDIFREIPLKPPKALS